MLESDAWERLRHFRQALYDDLGLRQDSLFELLDAMLTSPQRNTLVRLSLSSAFRRRWPSTCDALSDGSIDTAAVRRLFAESLADSARGKSSGMGHRRDQLATPCGTRQR